VKALQLLPPPDGRAAFHEAQPMLQQNDRRSGPQDR